MQRNSFFQKLPIFLFLTLITISLSCKAANDSLLIFWAPSQESAENDHDRQIISTNLPKLEMLLKSRQAKFHRIPMVGGWYDNDLKKDVHLPGYFYVVSQNNKISEQELAPLISQYFESKEVYLLKMPAVQWKELSTFRNKTGGKPAIQQLPAENMAVEEIFIFSVPNRHIGKLDSWLNAKVGGFSRWTTKKNRTFYLISPNKKVTEEELMKEVSRLYRPGAVKFSKTLTQKWCRLFFQKLSE